MLLLLMGNQIFSRRITRSNNSPTFETLRQTLHPKRWPGTERKLINSVPRLVPSCKRQRELSEVKKRGGSNFFYLFKFVVPPAVTDLLLLLLLGQGGKFLNVDPRIELRNTRVRNMKYETRQEYAIVAVTRKSVRFVFPSRRVIHRVVRLNLC